jgi:hypothetical protein
VSDEAKTSRMSRLDQNTLVPLGVVVSGALSLFGIHSWLTARFDQLDRRLERIEEKTAERWYRTDQRLWASELARKNPTLLVPDVEPAAPPR